MTRQELFDETARFLFTQGGPSLSGSGGICSYRGQDGRKCAVGFWIPDAVYLPSIEGKGICMDGTRITAELEPFIPPHLHEHAALLHELQKGHDRADWGEESGRWVMPWRDDGIAGILEWIAGRFNLNPGVIYACWPRNKEAA